MKHKAWLVGLLALAVVATPIAVWAYSRTDIAMIRRATARYRSLETAESDGFVALMDCIEKPGQGAMGVHYIRPDRLEDGELHLTEPEVLVYDFDADGKARLVAVEYVVPAATWADTWESAGDPEFLGRTLTYKTVMGPYRMSPYYEVHVWAWDSNPNGLFADWNPRVTCSAS